MNHPHPEASFQKNQPLRNPSDLKKVPVTLLMDPAWITRQSEQWWATNYQKTKNLSKYQRKMLLLRKQLLSFGGQQVCMFHDEPDLEQLLTYGEAWEPTNLKIKKGDHCQCHQNSLWLWNENPTKLSYATGYALSDDGMWRQHSWCLQPNTRGGRVVETTSPRLLYFGIIYTEEKTQQSFKNTL